MSGRRRARFHPHGSIRAMYSRVLDAFATEQRQNGLTLLNELLEMAPHHAGALTAAGVFWEQEGEFAKAERFLLNAIEVSPRLGAARHGLAHLLRKRGAHDAALAELSKAVAYEPDKTSWWIDLANCASDLGRHDIALDAFNHAVALSPQNAHYLADRAIVLHHMNRSDEAIDSCRAALQLDPLLIEAHLNLSLLLKEQRRWDETDVSLKTALSYFPNHPRLLAQQAVLYLEWGYPKRALDAADHLIAKHPSEVEGYVTRGSALLEQGRVDEAQSSYRHATDISPNYMPARWSLAMVSLLRGDLENGLRDLECRLSVDSLVLRPRTIASDVWKGESLEGKCIFVHAEQGLGDLIQFVRYASILKARGARRVVFEAPEGAVCLLATATGVDKVAVAGSRIPQHDLHIPLLSLPYRCGTRVGTIPAEVPYLVAPNRRVSSLIRASTGRLKVGIVWGGNPRHQRDRYRSIPFAALYSAVQSAGATLFSLQKGPHHAALTALNGGEIIDLAPYLVDLADAAAAVSALDLVITVDTSMAHLAGALGKRTWVLLPHIPDWRWFCERDDSPWYPTMRLFRQTHPGEWARPLGNVRIALHDTLRQLTRSTS